MGAGSVSGRPNGAKREPKAAKIVPKAPRIVVGVEKVRQKAIEQKPNKNAQKRSVQGCQP